MHAGRAAAIAPLQPSSFLAFDPGTRRVGVASGNAITGAATPLTTLPAGDDAALLAAIARLVDDWRPTTLVACAPRHPDGAAHKGTRRARRFAAALERRFGLPVHAVDERWSTTEALSSGARDPDAAAAAILLEQYLRDC